MNRREALRTLAGAATLPSLGLITAARGAESPTPGNASGALPRISVHPTGHYLSTADGRPFFWLGDTAWQLFANTTRDECSYYLHTRARQGFTVVQAVLLAEMDGVNTAADFGERPFLDGDPARPNERYFDRAAAIVAEAASLGLYVALLPAWGDKLTAPWGAGPRLFRLDNLPVARAYARYLGEKFAAHPNVFWMLGGDRPATLEGFDPENYPCLDARRAGFTGAYDWRPIWRQFAAGLAEGAGGKPVILYHPQGGPRSTSQQMPDEPWLSINGMQSGHGGGHDVPVWDYVARDFAISPARPTLDLEPNYEDHPYNPWSPRWDPATGWFRDHDVRKQTYRSVFAGACGVTYGHHAVWQFANSRREVINHADRDWIEALWRPAASQMRFLRELVESRPFFDRIPDQQLVAGDPGAGGLHLQATRDSAGSYAFVYFPLNDLPATIDLGRLRAPKLRAWWYDPRSGVGRFVGAIEGGGKREFRSLPYGPDWVLVLDDVAKDYAPPGLTTVSA